MNDRRHKSATGVPASGHKVEMGIYLRKYDVKVFLFKINTMAEYN